ncbi:CrcB family protein [Tetragenococcus halophilus]|uniref:fluoride efflux transporter FluC n=1 Tax=Tetragenococcus halophilus TaxID=51669 RepID=UPI001F15801F|nr:CrcB family protein [Tetragenococcus halophilus]MCF1684021.1 CrcB family protein [Tetragenococcus halophilus]
MYYVLLTIFGVLGAVTRYALYVSVDLAQFPLATLIVNLLGCFFLACITYFLLQMISFPKLFVSAFGTGFVGSFTTFSTFALESVELIQNEEYLSAATYVLASSFGGLVFCALGYQISKVLFTRMGRKKDGC